MAIQARKTARIFNFNFDFRTPSATPAEGNQPCISSRIPPHSVRPVHSAAPVMLLQRGLVGNEYYKNSLNKNPMTTF